MKPAPAPLLDRSEAPPALAAAFAARATIGAPELARLLDVDIKTVRRHVAAGNLVGRIKGLGRVHRHWVFTLPDVLRFLAGQAAPQHIPAEEIPCRSTAPKARRSGILTSRSNVIAFSAQPNVKTRMTLRPSKPPRK